MNELQGITPQDLELVAGTPLLLEVRGAGLKAVEWAEEHQAEIEQVVQSNGALLIRGLQILGSKELGTVLAKLFGAELIEYTYRSTPRTALRGNVYTATEYHPDQLIPQHNENSYSNRWALRLGFLCTIPASQGGATPICDSREVFRRVPPAVREAFERRGVMYVRNYCDMDVPWTEVFQTTDRASVESYCRENRIQFQWVGERGLRTRQVNQGTAEHPVTGEKVWFNQAHLFHVSNLSKEVQASLQSSMKEDDLPRNCYYGDGAPIAPETLATIRRVYDDTQLSFEWRRNDLLLLDNMLYSHGREPFVGERQVLVGMARPHGPRFVPEDVPSEPGAPR